MNVLSLAWRGIRSRPLSSILTALSVALGVGLVVAVMSTRASATKSFRDAARGYDVLLGPSHGSPLQLVMNTMFHVGNAGGTMPYEHYERALKDKRVRAAVPYAVGDSFRGHHVVGTTTEFFEILQDREKRPLGEGVRGTIFRPRSFDAVIGSIAASKGGLRRGDVFRVTHGVEITFHEHEEDFTVVGVMRPTGTPADRAIFIPIDTFYHIGSHAGDDDVATPLDKHNKELPEATDPALKRLGISAVGLRLVNPILRLRYMHEYRTSGGPVEAVVPVDQIGDLMRLVGSVDSVFRLTALLVILVAAIGILVSLYNTIQGRRREIAIMRALGARPHHVFFVLVLESVLLVLAGGLVGLLLGHGAVTLAAPKLLEAYGVFVESAFGMLDVTILAALAGIGVLVGLLPALRGLRTQVADNLYPR